MTIFNGHKISIKSFLKVPHVDREIAPTQFPKFPRENL